MQNFQLLYSCNAERYVLKMITYFSWLLEKKQARWFAEDISSFRVLFLLLGKTGMSTRSCILDLLLWVGEGEAETERGMLEQENIGR